MYDVNFLTLLGASYIYKISRLRVKQLHTLPVLHFNPILTTERSETTAQFNGEFDTDNQIYVP
jgi:hypothetical protein